LSLNQANAKGGLHWCPCPKTCGPRHFLRDFIFKLKIEPKLEDWSSQTKRSISLTYDQRDFEGKQCHITADFDFSYLRPRPHCKLHGPRTFLKTNIVVGFGVSLVVDHEANPLLVKVGFHQGPRPKKLRN
jgi:hypothetical protein